MSKTNYLLEDEDEFDGDESALDDLDIRAIEKSENRNQTKQTNVTRSTSVDQEDAVIINKSKLVIISALLETIKESQEKINQLLSGAMGPYEESRVSIGQMTESGLSGKQSNDSDGSRIIEGVFDGENMIGPDGKQYSVPANYASKSKLVEGDILKLTITAKGTFLYKQIGPIERSRVVGDLVQNENGSFSVFSGDNEWKVLTASVTYYKGRDGDEIVILVPKLGESKWAAVENIVRKSF